MTKRNLVGSIIEYDGHSYLVTDLAAKSPHALVLRCMGSGRNLREVPLDKLALSSETA